MAGRKQPLESVTKTDHVPAEFVRGQHHPTQHRVESRAIATAGQNTNPRLHFRNRVVRAIFSDQQDDL
jgi:2-hydroxychromene-2-carboxylate isomerase